MQWGDAPLHLAARSNNRKCLEILLSHGGKIHMHEEDVSNRKKKR